MFCLKKKQEWHQNNRKLIEFWTDCSFEEYLRKKRISDEWFEVIQIKKKYIMGKSASKELEEMNNISLMN